MTQQWRHTEPAVHIYFLFDQFCFSQKGVIRSVNDSMKSHRLFAVVHLCDKQFKITQEDIILLHDNRPFDIGDQIRLEKVRIFVYGDFAYDVGT